MSWWRRKRAPVDDLDRELTELRRHFDGSALDGLRVVRKHLSLGIDDGFERLRQNPDWPDVVLRHELDDRREEYVLQTASVGGIVVLKEYCHDESAFDPPEQDDYEFFEYEIELEGRIYEVRSYCDDDEAAITRSEAIIRDEDAERIARFLIEHEGVRRVTRMSRKTGAYTRIVALGPGWSGLDPLILLVLRDGPVRLRDLLNAIEEVNSIAPDKREVESSLGRLRGNALVHEDDERLALTDEGRALVVARAGERFWDEWDRLREALVQLPLPDPPGD